MKTRTDAVVFTTLKEQRYNHNRQQRTYNVRRNKVI